ncbi:MAG: DUF2188 domain-containing protein [Alphaproteobacteria bacterium]
MNRPKDSEKYTRDAEKELDSLNDRIEKFRSQLATQRKDSDFVSGTVTPIDWERTVKHLQIRAQEIGDSLEELGGKLRNFGMKDISNRLDDLKTTGEKPLSELRKGGEEHWSNLQARVETGFWDLRAMFQRISEGVQPVLDFGESTSKARYYFQKANDGRWALLLDKSDVPSMFFENKAEGLKTSRRYVREHRPSELVVRRADGTFQHVHNYPKQSSKVNLNQ